jgi:2-polyprenyl-3-methyl-5-hydroxy-6-metoxy-1,4-benzoquinol methylase
MAGFDKPLTACPCCRSASVGRYHCDSDGIVIFRCRDCGVQFMNPQYSDAYLKEYYSRYTVDEPHWDEPLMACHHFYVSLIERVKPSKGRLLDIGSGKGHLLRSAAERGWKAEGYEVDAATAETTGKKLGLTVHAGSFPSLPLESGTYDAVTVHHVLEHLKDPDPYLRKIHSLLKPDGVLFIALPNIRALLRR